MQYLIFTSDNGHIDWNNYSTLLKDEASHVWNLYKKGIVRNIWFTEQNDAVLLLETETQEEAERILNGFPLITNGLIRYSLHTLLPYTGFERNMDGTD